MEEALAALEAWRALDEQQEQEEAKQQHRTEDEVVRMRYPEPGLVTVRDADGVVTVRPMNEKEVAAWEATKEV